MSLQTVESNATDKWDNTPQQVRSREAGVAPEIKKYLDDILVGILAHAGVEHKFLNYYRENKLSDLQQKQLYSECFYFFQYLPFYITGMANKTRDENILREIVLNVYDEVGHKITHSSIYKSFMSKLDIDYDEVLSYQPLEVTKKLNDGIRKLYTECSIEKSLGALYADETMSSIMVSKLNDGLKNQGHDALVRSFWEMHIEVEIGHSNSVFNAIAPYVHSPETKKEFEEGVNEFLSLLEDYWNGVEKLLAN
jgi:pyrroloquinoline quinone (PQQ) biosynthesis protein C